MLTRNWLSSRGAMVSPIDDTSLEEGKSYVNSIMSSNGSRIDVDILSAVDDLVMLNLINQDKIKDDQEANNALKQLWSESLD